MEIQNGLYPTPQQIEAFRSSTDRRPIVMVNLLKFREKAVYEDGRHSDLSGHDAFMLYSRLMQKIVEGHGGRFLVSVLVEGLVIGTGDFCWDRIALVEYPSRAEFAKVSTSPEVQAVAVHRRAGLEGQLLVATTLQTEHMTSS